MKKLKKMISALALSASLLLTGCSGGTLNPPLPGADGGQQPAQTTKSAQAAQPAQGTTRANGSASPVSGGNTQAPAIDVGGQPFTVTNAVYCVTENGDMVMMTGEYDGLYVLLMYSSLSRIQANTSFSQKDFGSSMEVGAALVEPSAGLVVADNSSAGASGASFSVKDVSDSSMDISMSASVSGYDLVFNINASGTVTLTDLDTCTRIYSEFNDLAVSAESSSSSGGGGQPFTCPGCKGSKKCQHCDGDGQCSICLKGKLDHCISCGGTNRCQYCSGTGICHHCDGQGVMY